MAERQVHRRRAPIKDLDNNITGRHVIIVEDIIDSGLTMKYLRQLFSARNPASITTVSFLDKEDCHSESLKTDLCGFTIPNEFVVGYGLDYANYYRNLPYIGVLRPGVLSISLPESPNPPMRVWRFWLLSPIDETCISL